MSNFSKFLLALFIVVFGAKSAEAIGATLETPTIKDMYFGFVMAGLLANSSVYPEDSAEELTIRAEKISSLMMRKRGK
jgi:hypothetical protein